MKKTEQKKKGAFLCVVFLFIALAIFAVAILFFQRELKKIPDSILFIPSSEMTLTKEALIPTGKGGLVVGICTSVETSLGAAEVINEEYQRLEDIRIKKGEKMDFSVPQALVSESQAEKLGKQPGDFLELENKTFFITGIFQDRTFVQNLLPTKELNFILSQSPGQEEALVSRMLYWSDKDSFLYARNSSHELDRYYDQVFQGEFHNIALMKKTIQGLPFFLSFLLLIPVLWNGITFAWNLLQKAYQDTERAFFYRISCVLISLVLVILLCSIWGWLFGKMLPPRQYLPPEQIFDGAYYIDEMNRFYANLKGECGKVYVFQILAGLPLLQAGICGVPVVVFWGSWHRIKKKAGSRRQESRTR